MRKVLLTCLSMLVLTGMAKSKKQVVETWPDGTPMDAWFQQATKVDVNTLGKQYVLTDYGVLANSPEVQTQKIQAVIDRCAQEGGGVIVVPEGTFMTGALFFKQGTHLHVRECGTLKGSERIIDFPVLMTRIEGETCKYFAALINADGLDGFSISGKGTIDQRPRLTYVSNCKNVTIQDVHLINSPFWTNHVYKSDHVRYLDCYIYAPIHNVFAPEPKRGAPSSDAIDIDVCSDVHVKGCYMNVNDDAVVLKGGKGTWADKDSTNGPCERILIEDCHYGIVHGCLTLGSESVHDRNVILRRCYCDNVNRVLWLKMRTDTPQHYEYVLVEDIQGKCTRMLYIHPWSQFFKPGDRKDMPLSRCNNITMRNIQVESQNMFDVKTSEKYELIDFTYDGKPLNF